MADFCKACNEKLFGPDMPADLGGITKQADWEQGMAVAVLCEGCGPIQVDPEGNCVSQDCLCAGEPGHGLPWHLEPSKISFTETPTGRLQTTEPQPIEPRTKHQLISQERLTELLGPGGEAQYIDLPQSNLTEDQVGAIGRALISSGGAMMFSAGRSERDSLRSVGVAVQPLPLAEGEFKGAIPDTLRFDNENFPKPGMEFPVTGRPLAELELERPPIFEQVEIGTAPNSYFFYTTPSWPGAFRVVSVGGPGLRMTISVGRLEVTQLAEAYANAAEEALATLEKIMPTGFAEFRKFHGNAVLYRPVPRELEVTDECLRLVYAFLRLYHPGIEVEGVTASFNAHGPVVQVFGKLKEEADPNARADLKDA